MQIWAQKDTKFKDLREADESKKSWQECTEEPYKNGHNDQDRDDAGVTHIKTDMLEYEVKWALGSITTRKAREGDEIQLSCLKILKNEAVKVLHSICPQIWKTHQQPQCWKTSVLIPMQKKSNSKEFSTYQPLCSSHLLAR